MLVLGSIYIYIYIYEQVYCPIHEHKPVQIQLIKSIGMIKQYSRYCKSEYKNKETAILWNLLQQFDRLKDDYAEVTLQPINPSNVQGFSPTSLSI